MEFRNLNDQLMVNAAHRYCISRQTYVAGACVEWLRWNWPWFERQTRRVVVRDTLEAIRDDRAGHATIDRPGWEEFARWSFKKLNKDDQNWVLTAVGPPGLLWPAPRKEQNDEPRKDKRTD